MTEPLARPATTATALLAEWALVSPHAPWLFYRKGWDWQWRSWRRVADQVARGVDVLKGWGASGDARVAFDARQDPDGVAVALTIEAVGAVAVPFAGKDPRALAAAVRRGCAAWVGIEGGMPTESVPDPLEQIALPPALSAVDRIERRPLVADPESSPGPIAISDSSTTPLSAEAAVSAARLLERKICSTERLPGPTRQSIVCAAPGLDLSAFQLLQAWTLVRGAAWVLEPLPDAFLPTVLWARPTVIFGTSTDFRPLAVELLLRKHRRHSRLTTIVVVGVESVDETAWADLGIGVVALRENPVQSLIGSDF